VSTLLNFEVLIEESFAKTTTDISLFPIDKKHVISLINNFEDGNWLYKNFQDFIWNNIAETALSYQERTSLIDQPQSLLTEAAKKLRLIDNNKDKVGQGSELAEIVLYGIMKHYYKALPVVPKIFYKQNSQDNAKGADCVHIVLEGEDDFSIWFGEAKFYNSIEDDRLSEIIQSVENSLQREKLKKENSIITSISDLDYCISPGQRREYIREILASGASTDDLKPKLHIPILLIHECAITKLHNLMSQQYKDDIINYHKERAESYFKKQLKKLNSIHLYSEISFHIILFPVPEKGIIVDKFVSNVKHYKDQ